jgi:hypothetical protein
VEEGGGRRELGGEGRKVNRVEEVGGEWRKGRREGRKRVEACERWRG